MSDVESDTGARGFVAEEVLSALTADGLSCRLKPDSTILVDSSPLRLLEDIGLLSNLAGFVVLLDVFAVDYYFKSNERFQIIYNLLNIKKNLRCFLKVALENDIEHSPSLHSVSHIFRSASWYEREVYDMYGIEFIGHPDLRRILTDYGFRYHPMLKDFPLTGYDEVKYVQGRGVIYQPVDLPQDFRNFDSLTPWTGSAQKKGTEE